MRINDRLLVSSAYLFGIPALYIVLTDYRKKAFIGEHGAQAFLLWVLYFVFFFALRALIDGIWSMQYLPHLEKLEIFATVVMGSYAIFCGFRSFAGKRFRIPR